jgi:hypothetical protein
MKRCRGSQSLEMILMGHATFIGHRGRKEFQTRTHRCTLHSYFKSAYGHIKASVTLNTASGFLIRRRQTNQSLINASLADEWHLGYRFDCVCIHSARRDTDTEVSSVTTVSVAKPQSQLCNNCVLFAGKSRRPNHGGLTTFGLL